MNKIPNGLSAASKTQGSLIATPPSRIVPFPVSAVVTAKPLSLDRLSLYDSVSLYFTSLYELNKLVITAVYSFFESLFSGRASVNTPTPALIHQPVPTSVPPEMPVTPRPSVIVPFSAPQIEVLPPSPEVVQPVESLPVLQEAVEEEPHDLRLQRELAECLSSPVEYAESDRSSFTGMLLGQYFFSHLFKNKQGVDFDTKTGVFTLNFEKEQRIPITFGPKLDEKLGSKVRNLQLCLANEMKVKIEQGKIQFLGESLTLSGEVGIPYTPWARCAATVNAIRDENNGILQTAVSLNDSMSGAARWVVNNFLSVVGADLSKLHMNLASSIRFLHRILYSHSV